MGKRFGRKLYKWEGWYSTKPKAQAVAANYRKRGMLARIGKGMHKNKTVWFVYTRAK